MTWCYMFLYLGPFFSSTCFPSVPVSFLQRNFGLLSLGHRQNYVHDWVVFGLRTST